ncbi:hypothetical protein SUGI_0137930 [Cryptomeria japonica]|nr:hypothetical protein SUGI_0137930 [Cryptomeria japonica]
MLLRRVLRLTVRTTPLRRVSIESFSPLSRWVTMPPTPCQIWVLGFLFRRVMAQGLCSPEKLTSTPSKGMNPLEDGEIVVVTLPHDFALENPFK